MELCGTKISTPSITQTLFVPVVQTTANFVFSAENADTIKLTQSVEPTLPIDYLIMF